MYFPVIGDEVTLAEIEHYSKVSVYYEGQIAPAWEMLGTGKEIGDEAVLLYREYDPEQDVYFSAEALLCRVSDTSWAVVDMVSGYRALADLKESVQNFKIENIQAVANKYWAGLNMKKWLVEHAVLESE